jgi:hypothetical protein
MTPPRRRKRAMRAPSAALTKAIRHAIAEAGLAYEFCPGSYTAGALAAALAVEQVFLREADRPARQLARKKARARGSR